MGRTIERGGLVGISLVIALMIAIAMLNYRNTLLLDENAAQVSEAHEVLDLTVGVMLGLVNTETGERGFLLTSRDEFLRPYTDALPRIQEHLAKLKEKIKDESPQRERLDKLDQLTAIRLALLKERIDLYRRRARDIGALAAAMKGKEQMDAIRALVAEMVQDEYAVLEERRRQSNRAYRIAVTTGLLAAFAGLIFLTAFVTLLNRSLVERQAAMGAMRKQRELFRTTLASIGDAVITTDNHGQVTFLNPVAASMTGWKDEEAKGQPLESVFHIVNEDTRLPVDNPALKALHEGKIVGLANHTLLVGRDGSERPIDDSAAPIRDEQGTVAGVVLIFRDISDRARSEKALREADRLKDEYLAMLAHELRNPLAPIRNSLHIMRQAAADADTVVQARETAERQVQHMARLLDDLLDVSRISRGRIELRNQPVDLVSLVQRTIEAVGPFIKERHHHLEVSLPPGRVQIHGDPTRLEQILTNLLNNAAKYTKPGGNIWLRVEQADGNIVIRVRDNGIGISPEMLPHIFDLFVQAHRREDRTQSGVGIGLTLVRKLVQLHHGQVEASSRGLGQGSEFLLRLHGLPAGSEPQQAEEGNSKEPPAKASAQRILVVDDNRDAAESLAMVLRLYGHSVQVTYEGHSAISMALDFRPSVIFLDIGMPGMDGYEVAKIFRQDPNLRQAKLVALTGWGQEGDRIRSQEAGFDHHLVKPVEPDTLKELLAE